MGIVHHLNAPQRNGPPPVDAGGGPPYDGDMDARVTKLEGFAAATSERLARMESKLDRVVHDVGQWKWFALGAVLTIVMAVLGTGIAIQQMTVTTFQAAAEASRAATPATQAPPAAK